MDPSDLGWRVFSGSDHFDRAFNADDNGVRPSLLDQLGDVAGPGAKVGNAPDREIRNPHQKIDRGSKSVPGKFQILLRIPYHRFFFFLCATAGVLDLAP